MICLGEHPGVEREEGRSRQENCAPADATATSLGPVHPIIIQHSRSAFAPLTDRQSRLRRRTIAALKAWEAQ